ncbi:Alpha/Beta hydrolase protein, partial [Staphylotrichum tortipilum]
FLFTQTPCALTASCLVHTGFALSWAEVSSRVHAGVRAALAAHPAYPVVVTGHSLGGAVATLAAAHLRADDGVPADLYTYGSPRVGNLEFAKFVSDQAEDVGGANYRVTHTDDPVPRLPPISFNYRHVSPEYWIQEGSDRVVELDEVEYCPGYSNVECNGGTKGLDLDAHGWYFQGLYGCLPATPSLRRGELSDEELAARLNMYAGLDVEVARNLHAGGQS